MRKRNLWEARGTSQVDTRRGVGGSGTRAYHLQLIVLVRPLLLVRLPNQLIVRLVHGRHLLLWLLLTWRGRRRPPPATSGPPPPPILSLRHPLRLLLQPVWSLVNRVHGPMMVTHHLCSITCNKKEKQEVIRNRCINEQNIITKNIVIHVLEIFAKMNKT